MFRKRSEEDFAREIESHLQLEADDLRAEGQSSSEAHRSARASFGNPTQARERFYLRSRIHWLDNLVRDLRYALRGMTINPGFTIAAVLTLALGMGANIAIFTLINAVLLRTLPVSDPSSLYFVRYAGAKGLGIAPPYPCFEHIHDQAKSLASITAYTGYAVLKVRFGSSSGGNLESATAARVSGDYYRVLGLQPALGRLLAPEDQALNPAVAVISYDYWQTRFSGDPSAVGQPFILDGHSFTIVGVTPRSFHGIQPGTQQQITIPMTTMNLMPHDGDGMLVDHNSPWFEAIARLNPGVSPQQARGEIDAIFQSYMQEFPVSPESRRDQFHHIELTSAARGLTELREQFSRPLKALMAVVILVLLIACANITNLLLARAAKREREFAVRVAMGAGRARLFCQLLTETTLLFLLGAAASLLVALLTVKLLIRFFLTGPTPIALDLHWDWRILAFTVLLPLAASLLFGTTPILQVMRVDPHSGMREGPRISAPAGRLNLGRALIVLQICLSLILLVGASLFLRTLRNLHSIDPGFASDRVMLLPIQLLESSYPERAARIAAWDRILASVRALPGVQSAAFSMMTPFDTSGRHVGFSVPGYQPPAGEDTWMNMNTVSEDYFATLNTRLLAGRSFTTGDTQNTPPVALVNQSAVRQFFSGHDPIGAIVHVNENTYRIVGLVQDIHQSDLRQPSGPFIYLPMRQPYDRNFRMTLSIRTALPPASLTPILERIIHSAAPDSLAAQPSTLSAQLDQSLVNQRLIATLVATFSALALFLSAVGLYGVLAYTVARRTPEIALRIALGALPRQVIRAILNDTLKLLALGLTLGIPASILLATAAKSLFYGIAPTDLAAQITAALLLAAVALAASYIPASKVTKIDPATALRSE